MSGRAEEAVRKDGVGQVDAGYEVGISRRTLLGMATLAVTGWLLPTGAAGRWQSVAWPGAAGPRIAVVPFHREMLRAPHPWAG